MHDACARMDDVLTVVVDSGRAELLRSGNPVTFRDGVYPLELIMVPESAPSPLLQMPHEIVYRRQGSRHLIEVGGEPVPLAYFHGFQFREASSATVAVAGDLAFAGAH